VTLRRALVWWWLVRRAGVRLVVVLLDLARAGVLRMLRVLRVVRVRVVVWRRQALGRVGVMLLGECGQQLGWANK
jgi:hypothetical protein